MKFRHVRSLFPVSLSFKGCPSLTRQEFAPSSDMNYIVSKFLRTGQIDLPNVQRPMIDGLEYPNDFTEACNMAFEQRNLEVAQNEQKGTEKEQSTDQTESPKSDPEPQPAMQGDNGQQRSAGN